MPVTFCIDRAGISGADGETHQGVFDLSYLSLIPNLTIAVPKDTAELRRMLQFSATYAHPFAIRYPRAGRVLFPSEEVPLQVGKWEYLQKTEGAKVSILAAGERCLIIAMKIMQNLQAQGKSVDVVNARFVKPLDIDFLQNLSTEHIITIEDNVFLGGFGSAVNGELIKQGKRCKIKNYAYRDEFIQQGSIAKLQADYGVNCQEIQEYVTSVLS